MLVSAAAIDREQRLAGFLVDHRGRIGKLELVLPAALATEIDVDVAVHEVVTVVQGRRVLIGPGGPVMHIERRSEEHTSELQSLMRISYAFFCLTKKTHMCNIKYYMSLSSILIYFIYE